MLGLVIHYDSATMNKMVFPSARVVAQIFLSTIAIAGNAFAGELSVYQEKMLSADGDVRAEGMREFSIDGPEKFGADSELLMLAGIADSSNSVVEFAVYALDRFTLAAGGVIERRTEFSEYLKNIIESHPKSEVIASSVRAYARINNDITDIETIVIDHVMQHRGFGENHDLLSAMAHFGVQKAENRPKIMEIIRAPPNRESLPAVLVAMHSNFDPEILLPEVIRLVQSNELFAHPDLLSVLSENPHLAKQYWPVLEDIRRKMLSELEKERSARSVVIYNDEFYLEKLNETISILQSEK